MEMQQTLRVKRKFDSAHRLNNYNGPCANLHGHTWVFEVYIDVHQLDPAIQFGIDFKEVKKTIDEQVTDVFDHRLLNDIVPQPTAEKLGQYILEKLTPVFSEKFSADVTRVDLWETENSCVTTTWK